MKTKTLEIETIEVMLNKLPPDLLNEVKDFTSYLLKREQRRAAFEERVLRSASLPRKKFSSIDAFMKAIDEIDEAD